MKKAAILLSLLFLLLSWSTVCAQDFKATAEALEYQLQIMQLQATISALESSSSGSNTGNSSSGSSSSGGDTSNMWNWNSQNSPYYSTPTPFGGTQSYANTVITSQNFPSQVRPPVPGGPPPTWKIPSARYRTEITVGDAGQYRTIADAMKNIPSNAGEVTIYMVSDTDEPQTISVPFDKKITSLRITSNNNNKRTAYPSERSIWLFCNGIPLIIDQTVTIGAKSMIMGGFVTYSGHNVEAPKSTIIINGNAHWIYAGGQSDREGHCSTVGEALVIINGKVDRVFAGGRSIYGETVVHNSTIVVNGTANEIYCSGYTEYASAKATVGRADMKIYGWYNTYGLTRGAGQAFLQNPNGCY